MKKRVNLIKLGKHLRSICRGEIYTQVPLSRYTSLKIGGIADFFILPEDITSLQNLIKFIYQEEIPYFVLGNGTNILISDKGFRGIVIRLTKGIKHINIQGERLSCGAGASLGMIAKVAQEQGLSGLEWTMGIPGTAGGGVVSNAGANSKDFSNIVVSVLSMETSGEIIKVLKKDMDFGYRQSIFQNHRSIILEVNLKLKPKSREEIKMRMEEILKRRKLTQPISCKSAGSVFKNPTGYHAAWLIEQASAKGLKVGDAQVSTKHANFIINRGKAKAIDVYKLIEMVKKKVWESSKIELLPEIQLVGEF